LRVKELRMWPRRKQQQKKKHGLRALSEKLTNLTSLTCSRMFYIHKNDLLEFDFNLGCSCQTNMCID
jgi:hypothetical protein